MKKSILFWTGVILIITIFGENNVFGADANFVIDVLVPGQIIMLQAKELEKNSQGAFVYERALKEGMREIAKTYFIASIVPINKAVGWGSATSSLIIFVTKK